MGGVPGEQGKECSKGADWANRGGRASGEDDGDASMERVGFGRGESECD